MYFHKSGTFFMKIKLSVLTAIFHLEKVSNYPQKFICLFEKQVGISSKEYRELVK